MHLCENWEFENEKKKKIQKIALDRGQRLSTHGKKGSTISILFRFRSLNFIYSMRILKVFVTITNKQTLKSANLDFSIFLW
jgi:hypothetical protein